MSLKPEKRDSDERSFFNVLGWLSTMSVAISAVALGLAS